MWQRRRFFFSRRRHLSIEAKKGGKPYFPPFFILRASCLRCRTFHLQFEQIQPGQIYIFFNAVSGNPFPSLKIVSFFCCRIVFLLFPVKKESSVSSWKRTRFFYLHVYFVCISNELRNLFLQFHPFYYF